MGGDLQTEAVVEIALDPASALRRLAFETGCWWPACYAWQPTPAGARPGEDWCDLGRIVRLEPAAGLALRWDLGHGPAGAREAGGLVEITVEPVAAGRSRVRVRHRWPPPLEADARFLHEALASGDGWATILAAYADSAGAERVRRLGGAR
ncbi:hypothetical protein [Salinarimonas soli]|uniref:hypothetical protein n=1 Tax=Salinarimonas soli TaxID=1638099 RepID=UPI001661D073|nr:hypothetical protein [Salinarimonas soli]